MPIDENGSIGIEENLQESGGSLEISNIFVKINGTTVVDNLDNIIVDSVFLFWDISNASDAKLKIQKKEIGRGTINLIGDPEYIDILNFNNADGYELVLDKKYSISIQIIAQDSSGYELSSDQITLRKASSNFIPENSIINQENGFSIQQAGADYDFNAIKFSILLNYDSQTLDLSDPSISLAITLFYTYDKNRSWTPVSLKNTNYIEIKDDDGNTKNYEYKFGSNGDIKINPPQDGGVVFFYCRVLVKRSSGAIDYFTTKEEFLFFDTAKTQTNEAVIILDSSSSKPANLKYEIKTRISEMYASAENSRYEDTKELIDDSFAHYFLDSIRFKGKAYSDLAFTYFINSAVLFGFPYQADSTDQNNTKGYFYPACISEILPCINISLDSQNDNNVVTLFWKIIDDFYEYSFFNESITIKTNELKVSVEYLDSGVYKEILSDLLLEYGANKNYDSVENKFFIKISRNNPNLKNIINFNRIKESDNQNKNLRIVVKSHKVTASSPFGVFDYSFKKLLISPQWTHIVYDQFIPSSSRDSIDKKFKLNLDSNILRGIVIPDAAFKKFDVLKRMEYSTGGSNPRKVVQDYKILFKLYTEVDAIYTDPIREGTITYVEIPSKPETVFLIPPKVNIPPPNIDTENGVQAEAEVSLDEYGKIAGIKIIEPGNGYSVFKDESSKRIQTFSDLTPVVKSSYKIVSQNLNIQKDFLILKNPSFSRLRASMDSGIPLTDIFSSSRTLDAEQKQIFEDYKQRNNFKAPNEQEESRDSLKYNNLRNNPDTSVSIKDLDLEWYNISSLYSEKYNNPLDNLSIYNKDTDIEADFIDDSNLSENVQNSSSSIENPNGQSSLNSDDQQIGTSTTSQTFALNNLIIYTDSSPGISLISNASAPPWLTLLPKEYRADAAPAYGALPNMLPRAYNLYNRLSNGINNLNEVRVMIPMIWAVDYTSRYNSYYLNDAGVDPMQIINWSQEGKKVELSNVYSYYQPINSSIVVSASRSVGRTEIKRIEKAERGIEDLAGDVFVVSTEDGSSASFTPFIHPWMEKAFPEFYLRSYRRKFLGIVVDQSYTCSSYTPYTQNGAYFIPCAGVWGDPYPKQITLSSVPVDQGSTQRYFQFFTNGQISASPNGTAQALSLPNGTKNGRKIFCTESCGTSNSKAIDFKYTNMYPGTVKI